MARSVTEQVGPLTGAAAIHLAGGAFCWGRFLFGSKATTHSFRRLPVRFLIGCGSLFVIYLLSLYLAVGRSANRSQVLEIGLINYLWPSFTILFSLVLLNKKPGPALIPGTFLAVLGVFLVLTGGHSVSLASMLTNVSVHPFTYVLAMVAAVSWGLYSNLTRRWAGASPPGGVEIFVSVTGGIFLLLRLIYPETSSWTWRAGFEVAFLGMATATAYLLWDLSMRKGDIVLVAACSYFTPFFSTLLSCLYLHVSGGFNLWLGCLMIVAGSLLSWTGVSARTPVHLPQEKTF